jgi:large subunit ribosomal protein L18
MDHQKLKLRRQLRRRNHVRRRITGTPQRPRLSVFRSSKHIYAQLIDDLNGVTLAAASSNSPALRESVPYGGNIKAAAAVGKLLAEVARAKGIDKAAFDRGHYRFHGRVKALAEAATAGGLQCCSIQPKEPEPAAKPEKPEKAAKAPKEKKEKKEKAPVS